MGFKEAARRIANIVQTEWTDETESLPDFFVRRLGQEGCGDAAAAIDLCVARERGTEAFRELLDLVAGVGAHDASLAQMVELRRAKGYCATLEAILARPWLCPHCGARATLLTGVMMPTGPLGWPSCADCGEEDIAPAEPKADVSVIDGGKR